MGPCRLLKTIFAQFLGKYRVVSALFGKIERLTFTGTFDAFQHLVKSHSFKQICFPHRSEMGVLKSFLDHFDAMDVSGIVIGFYDQATLFQEGFWAGFVLSFRHNSLLMNYTIPALSSHKFLCRLLYLVATPWNGLRNPLMD